MNDFEKKGKEGEELVNKIAYGSFFYDWCFPNPKLEEDGKEVCDLLVVFDRYLIIIQVKNCKLHNGLYKKQDIEKNIKQLQGAFRSIFELKKNIIIENSRRGNEKLDVSKVEKVFTLGVFLGEEQTFHSMFEYYKKLKIHIFDEKFFEICLSELDTMRDFIKYLEEKESIIDKLGDIEISIIGGEENLLSIFLKNDRSLSHLGKGEPTSIIIDGEHWVDTTKQDWYKRKKENDKISIVRDNIVNTVHRCGVGYEVVAKYIADTTRIERRLLGKAYLEAHKQSNIKLNSDLFVRYVANKEVVFTFLFGTIKEQDGIKKWLQIYCEFGKLQFPENNIFVGIYADKDIYDNTKYSFCLIDMTNIATDYIEKIKYNKSMIEVDYTKTSVIQESEY